MSSTPICSLRLIPVMIAGSDARRVLHTEPLPPEHPLLGHPKVTVVPHVAAITQVKTAARTLAGMYGACSLASLCRIRWIGGVATEFRTAAHPCAVGGIPNCGLPRSGVDIA